MNNILYLVIVDSVRHNSKKTSKKLKKRVDKREWMWYYNLALAKRGRETDLEN